ncbi:MAG: cobyrinate a,c-diamide synthase [Cyanobacteriota bacterium]|nr:cobyrinate a,c-diamide synthase [Cyanobacteriota bacterium]
MSCLIAAPCSGSGKTLLTLSLSAWARHRGASVQPFKVGPDYLDPQLLSQVAGRVCRNLDPLLCGGDWVRNVFHWHSSRADCAVVEGVMGLFDGQGPTSEGSSAQVAQLLDLPVVLVVEASRQSGSVAALVRGFRDHAPPAVRLAGVVLNRVGSERHRALLKEALAAIGMPVLGVFPPHPALELPSRHLGLLPPGELRDWPERLKAWVHLAEAHLDLERLWPLLRCEESRPSPVDPIATALAPVEARFPSPKTSSTVAVAQDAAFHFSYPESFELLAACGLEPRPWSPLADEPLPDRCGAVLLPGGYPELHAPALAAARRSRAALARAHRQGVPIVAECGGLLFLGDSVVDPNGTSHAMAGLLPFQARPGGLSLGYRQARAQRDGLLVRAGESYRGHEFHRWQLHPTPSPPVGDAMWQLDGWGIERSLEGWTTPTLHATWLHLHWAGFPTIPRRLADAIAGVETPAPEVASCSPKTAHPRPFRSAGA